MSNFLAIATVTATLQAILQDAVAADVPGANATAARPNGSGPGPTKLGVNVYLYQVTPNSAWRNADLPTRTGDGRLVQRPQVALDLHYLLTFYGNEAQLEPQRILGSAVRALHARPLLSRDAIQETVEGLDYLAGSDLADEVELVKFMPVGLSLEDLSKLWSVFFQTPYTLSIAYRATVVLIEAQDTPQRTLPVRVRTISASPFRQPALDRVMAAGGRDAPVVMDEDARLQGRYLDGEVLFVRIGAAELTPTVVGSDEISVQLTDADLRAGVQGVQVVYASGAESNVAPLVLRPRIPQDAGGDYEIELDTVLNEDGDPVNDQVTVQVTPPVGPRQKATLFLNEHRPATPPGRAYSFEARARDMDTTTLEFPTRLGEIAAGTYLVRVQVAGAESPLETDANGFYVEPQLIVS
jgi:hypothetical protein